MLCWHGMENKKSLMFSCLHIHIRFLYRYFFITLSPDHHACITTIPLTGRKSKHWNVVVLHMLFLFGCYANTSNSLCPQTWPLKEKPNSRFASHRQVKVHQCLPILPKLHSAYHFMLAKIL